MIAVLADGDPNGYPFLVAKVIKVIMENEDVVGVEDPEFPHPTSAVTTIVKAKIEDNTFFFTLFSSFYTRPTYFPGKRK